MRILLYITLFIGFSNLFIYSCGRTSSEKDSESHVLWLEHDGTRIGVLPDVGGRIVYFSVGGIQNILKSDSTLWDESDSLRPAVSENPKWKSYYGHTVWLGPQSEWWTHQELNMDLKLQKAVWPPDPWLIYSAYKVMEHTSTKVIMEGPKSPVSGMQLVKEIELMGQGEVVITVRGKNIRKEEIAWDLWMNTRVDGYMQVYIPINETSKIKVRANSGQMNDTVAYAVEQGYFSYLPAAPPDGKKQRSSKAFITPSQPWMAAFRDSSCFFIEFELYDTARTHAEQGLVELYNFTSDFKDDALTEMEYHGPYTLIPAGESISVSEKWKIIPYYGTENERKAFLDTYLQ